LNTLKEIELLRIKANTVINPKHKSSLGQFFTPYPICLFMASLFKKINGEISLLDPGSGAGSLTAAFVDEAIRKSRTKSLDVTSYEIDPLLEPFIKESFSIYDKKLKQLGVKFNPKYYIEDFIFSSSKEDNLTNEKDKYTHIIMNPPYKKILANSDHRKALRKLDIETVNLYSGFLAIAIQQLKSGGELVAIIPRSFCNGPYYQSLRELILKETAIQHIHIFDSRTSAFADDEVLQENIIIHLIKGKKQNKVLITSSPGSDFHRDEESQSITATDKTIRNVSFDSIVNPNDKQKFIHIASNERDQEIIDELSIFNSTLKELNLEVSTGPIVGFRSREDLRENLEEDAVPLIYPIHLKDKVEWPSNSKKPNAIHISDKTKRNLWDNNGHYILIKRISSKEEKRRIVATIYDGSLPGDFIGFENKLNVFHYKKNGLNDKIVRGLYVYLNSSLLDKYYRLFSGHTQINATDLKTLHYPNLESLIRIGDRVKGISLSQKEIDTLLKEEIIHMGGTNDTNPLAGQEKLDQALEIITKLGMPREQQNERSALTFLALLNITPDDNWDMAERSLIGVTPIMNWCRDNYGKEYAPNTRETFRRQTLHQFVDGGICLYNPDKPDRAVNSPKACYQVNPEVLKLVQSYGNNNWEYLLNTFLKNKQTLINQYAMKREVQMISLVLNDGTKIKLSPGKHSQLIHDIVNNFGPIFAPGAEVLYLGDTGAKQDYFNEERLKELGVVVNKKGKLPDVVLYWSEKNWILLIESVTSHGPVDGKRHSELAKLFNSSTAGLVYVTAFPDRATMKKYLADISWETEVWIAEDETHMIHFNGDRFLGPHN
jgi:adenine-specific DNA-methyltransferase